MQKKWVEIKIGDVVLFMGKTGTASFTTLKDKGTYFMPAKTGMRLDGYKIPVLKNEAFIYNGYTELGDDRKTCVNRINIRESYFLLIRVTFSQSISFLQHN